MLLYKFPVIFDSVMYKLKKLNNYKYMEINITAGIVISVLTLIATIVGVYYAYRQYYQEKEGKPSIIEVKPPTEIKSDIYIDTSKKNNDESLKNDNETKKEISSYKPLDDEFYINFGTNCEFNKRGGDIFSIKEE